MLLDEADRAVHRQHGTDDDRIREALDHHRHGECTEQDLDQRAAELIEKDPSGPDGLRFTDPVPSVALGPSVGLPGVQAVRVGVQLGQDPFDR